MPLTWRRFAGALFPFLLLSACGGGGGGGGSTVSFSLSSVAPAVSTDLSGGDVVTITGTNFTAAMISGVTFGGVPATNRQVLSDTQMTVQTPAAPGGVAGAVTVTVSSIHGGAQQLTNGYTYTDVLPTPAQISPTSFTPSGAETFTITGTALGPLGGTVTVLFQGIGSVSGSVSANGTTVTGRAPVSPGVPPIGGITVTVDTGSSTADVPTPVSYSYSPPSALAGIPFQAAGGASQPVRLADGFAVLCTAGADATWNTSDDEVRIVRGPPNAISSGSVFQRNLPGTQVGYLSITSSIPAILGPDTFCVYTNGPAAGTPGFVLVTNARTAPVADVYPYGGINAAPIAAIGPSRIAYMSTGLDGVFGVPPGNTSDDLVIADFNLAAAPPVPLFTRATAGFADITTTGSANLSIPFSADGDTIFVMGAGGDGVPGTVDDRIVAHVMSTATTSTPFPTASLLGRPIAFSSSLLAAPGAGGNGTFGDNDDTLDVFTFNGTAWASSQYALGGAINVATALVPYARIGNGIAVAISGGIRIYTNPASSSGTTFPFVGTPLMVPLGNGGLVSFGPGNDLAVRTNDDQALHLDALATTATSFSIIPNLFQVLPVPLAGTNRVLALSPGPDGVFATTDDTAEIYQSLSIGEPQSVTQLPVSALPLAPVTGAQPFVPIGPGWGLIQSPGANRIFGDIDDQLILVAY